MAQQPVFPPGPGAPVGPGAPGRPGFPTAHTPSGLFPSVPPSRPTYREPHPVRGVRVAAGGGAAGLWLLVFGLLGPGLVGYLWWTVLAGVVAWLAALLLVRLGDRGVAAGIAIVTAGGWSIASAVLVTQWLTSGNWPLW